MRREELVQFKALGYDALLTFESDPTKCYSVEFKAYAHFGVYPDGRVLYGTGVDKMSTDDVKLAQVFVHGGVKWDGCSNIYFDEQDHVMLHGCSRKDLTNVGLMLGAVFDACQERMPNTSHLE